MTQVLEQLPYQGPGFNSQHHKNINNLRKMQEREAIVISSNAFIGGWIKIHLIIFF
jgi:hypothetical protein